MAFFIHEKLSRFLQPWLNTNQTGFKKKDGTVPHAAGKILSKSGQMKFIRAGIRNFCIFFDLIRKPLIDQIEVFPRRLLVKLSAAGVTNAALK